MAQDIIVSRTLSLLVDGMEAQYQSVGFPELVRALSCVCLCVFIAFMWSQAFPILQSLRRFSKSCKQKEWKKEALEVVRTITSASDRVLAARRQLNCAPNDTAKLTSFMTSEREAAKQKR